MGKFNYLTLVQFLTPNGQSMIDDDNDALRTNIVTSGVLSVTQVSGQTSSVNVVQINGQTPALGVGDVDAGTLRLVSVKSALSTTTSVSVGADASTNIVPTNSNRKSILITHKDAFNLYVSTGTVTSLLSFPIKANQVIVFDDYTGPVNAIAEETAGTISVRYIEIV